MQSSTLAPNALFRRKKEHKRGITYTVLLVGNDGTGKTTFANNLLESSIFPHRYNLDVPQGTNNPRLTISKPTKVMSFNSKSGMPSSMVEFDPSRAHLEPGITITSTSVEISTAEEHMSSSASSLSSSSSSSHVPPPDKILFNLINTYGVGENLDNSLCFEEITAYLEQQFDLVLAEETRIKRNPRFEDTRVHVALYFIEPTGHGLREIDVEMMKKLSRYTNVLPIISKADSFTKSELHRFKQRIMDDVERFNVPVYKFEVDEDEDDLETIEENQGLAMLQPFAVVCSDIRNQQGKYVRSYPWGDLNIDDENVSDLRILKNVLFGSHLQEFKDTIQNFLYENYRAEKLSSVAEWDVDNHKSTTSNGIAAMGLPDTTADKRQSAAPSLSNFASLLTTGQFKSSQSLALPPQSETPSTPKMDGSEAVGADSEDKESSPIRQISQSIKRENEEIIKSIKNSPRLSSGSPDRMKLRNISETVPYVLKHERIIARQQKLEELEAQSAKELQKRIAELEKKAAELKLRERLLRQQHNESATSLQSDNTIRSSATHSQIKKEDTFTDLASIASGRD